MAVFADGDLGD